jgi:osmotically inducible protein OsmC
MPEIVRKGSATWTGDLKTGQGKASTGSGALRDVPMSFARRFGDEPGSNPEELIAAAHATCFSMALSKILAEGGNAPDSLSTTATVKMSLGDAGVKITSVHLECEGKVPGISADGFADAAGKAKEGCPVSQLLAPGLEKLTLEAKLVG